MSYVWHVVFELPEGLALAAGIIVLVRRRQRSRIATGLALTALSLLAAWWAAALGFTVAVNASGAANSMPIDVLQKVMFVGASVRAAMRPAGLALLVCAVLADRETGPRDGIEADYTDANDGRHPASVAGQSFGKEADAPRPAA